MDGGVMTMQPPPNKQYHHMVRMPNYQRPPLYIPNARTPMPPKGITNAQQSDAGVAGGNPFDGKRMRKAVHRKTIDYNTTVINYLQNRVWQRDFRDSKVIQPDGLYHIELVPPLDMIDDPMNCVTTRFMRQSTNKFRCPIFCLAWTPEGRRLVTGASSGEFTLWNGLTFNFETILQAHDTSVRAMVWSHNDQWMVTGDHIGYIKYWQSNMNNVKMYQGHKEAIRCISFCPTDAKFATCSDDGTIRVWDFLRCLEEKILRGHGADVKCVDWHPQKSLIASGSKDNQQPIKLWDPKSGQSLATLHAHKATVMDLQWNKNGNWLLTAARDHLMKLFDIRNMKEEVQIFKGHKKEATAVAWHPAHEDMFASGGSDGAILFWNVGTEKEVGGMEEAHDAIIWDLAWHPLGHILASASNDHSTKFWTRNRPGDRMRDKYNLNTLPIGPDGETLDIDMEMMDQMGGIGGNVAHLLPGMGLEHGLPPEPEPKREPEEELPSIPGLDWSTDEKFFQDQQTRETPRKKVPYSRPIPKSFEQAWISNKQSGVLVPDEQSDADDKDAGGAAAKLKSPAGFGAPRRENIPSLMSLPTKGPNNAQLQEKDEPKIQPPQNTGPSGHRLPNQGMGLLGPAPGLLLPNQTSPMRPPTQPPFIARPSGTGQSLQPSMPHPNKPQGPRTMGPGQWTSEGNGPDGMGQNLQHQQQQKQGLLRPPGPAGPHQPGQIGQPRMPGSGGPRGPPNQRMPLHPVNQPQGPVNQPRPQGVNMGQDKDFRGNPSIPHMQQEQQRQQQQQEFMDTGDFDHRSDRDFREDRDFRNPPDYGQNNRGGEMFQRNRGAAPSIRGRGRGSYDDRSGGQGHLGQQDNFNSYGRGNSDSRQWPGEEHEMMDTDVRLDRDERSDRNAAPNFSRGRGAYNENRGHGGPFSDNRGQANVNETRDSYERDNVWGGNQGNRTLGNYGGPQDQDRRQYSDSSDPLMGGRKGNWKEGPGDELPEEVGLGMVEQYGSQQTSWAEDMPGRQDFQSERGGFQSRGGLRGSSRGRGGEMRGRGVDRGRGMVHRGGRGVGERAGFRGGGGSWN